jgi:preprotein translocase subunit SecD
MILARRLVLGLAIVAFLAVAIVFGWRFHRQWKHIPDMAADGGTILVYEIDDDPSGTDYKPADLVAAVHRRLRYAAPDGITVQPAGDKRVEIAVPSRGAAHAQDVARIKELLAENGKLEFRVLANSDDDQLVFDTVLNNPVEREQLKAAAAGDKPPPAPRPIAGQAFDTALGSFTYSWVELGRKERAWYKLTDNEGAEEPGALWEELAEARKDHKAVAHDSGKGLWQYRTNLFYSREAVNPDRLSERGRGMNGKEYEYFILCRDPERDEDGHPKAVTGEYLRNAYATLDPKDREAIGFELNPDGASRLKDVTSANKGRELAIILDGVIRSAPNVEGPIGATGIISGDFTRQEVDRLTNILRAGYLPVTLKPQPVSETTVEPRK